MLLPLDPWQGYKITKKCPVIITALLYLIGTSIFIFSDIRSIPIKIASASLDLQSNGKMNNDQTSKIRQLATNNKIVDLYKIIQDAIDVSAQMQKVYQNVTHINYTQHYDLSRQYQKYLNLTSNDSEFDKFSVQFLVLMLIILEIKQLEEKILLTRAELNVFIQDDTAFEKIKKFNARMASNTTQLSSIENRLKELKAKVQRAKEAADGVSEKLHFVIIILKH